MLVTVRSVTKRTTRNRRTMVNAPGRRRLGSDGRRVLQPAVARDASCKEGLQIALFGKADTYRGGLQMTNPIVDLIGDRTGRIVPIYPQSEKAQLNTWEMAGWVEEALRRCRRARHRRSRARGDPRAARPRRPRRRRCARSTSRSRCGRRRLARRRLAFDELLRVQLVLVLRKRELERDVDGARRTRVDGELVRRFHDGVAVSAHRRAAARRSPRSRRDLAAPHPMHRLLQGDVGSGKTVVAVSTLLRRRAGRSPGRADGADRGARRAARDRRAGAARRPEVPDPGNLFGDRPLRVELLTNRVTGADRKDDPGRARRWHDRHRDRHARADPGERSTSTASVRSSSTSSTDSVSSSGPRCATKASGTCPTCS